MKSNLSPESLRQHNTSNLLHTVLLVGGTALLMGLIAYTVLGWLGMAVALVFGIVGSIGITRISPKMVLGLYKAKPLPPNELPQLHELVRELARKANLPAPPQLYLLPSKVLNAFAVGTREDAAIAVTDGLLRTMNMQQLGGILAHEMAHVMNGDLKVMGAADILNRITSFMSTLGLLGIPAVFGMGLKLPLSGLLLLIFAPTVGGLLQLGLSRAREYNADIDGVELTGDPEGLIEALRILDEKQKGQWEGLFLPGSRVPHPSLLRTHPMTEDRVARLKSLKPNLPEQVTYQHDQKNHRSIVPQVRNPAIKWHRLGIYF
jgi:heat shock protein HtpX